MFHRRVSNKLKSRKSDVEDSESRLINLNEHNKKAISIKSFPDKYANVSPLGLLGFGMTTIMLSFANVGLY